MEYPYYSIRAEKPFYSSFFPIGSKLSHTHHRDSVSKSGFGNMGNVGKILINGIYHQDVKRSAAVRNGSPIKAEYAFRAQFRINLYCFFVRETV